MLNTINILTKATWEREFLSDTTWDGMHRKLNTTGVVFLPGSGLGDVTGSDTSLVLLHIGGSFANQWASGVFPIHDAMKSMDEEFGIGLRCYTTEETDDTYYFFRIDGGYAKITKILDNAYTTLVQGAFDIDAENKVSIVASADGTLLTMKVVGHTTNTIVNIAATDAAIPNAGAVVIKTTTCPFVLESIKVMEL